MAPTSTDKIEHEGQFLHTLKEEGQGPALQEHLHQRQGQVQEPAGVRVLAGKPPADSKGR